VKPSCILDNYYTRCVETNPLFIHKTKSAALFPSMIVHCVGI